NATVTRARAFAACAKAVAKNYGVRIPIHTDPAMRDKLDNWVIPLMDASEAEVKAGRDPIFHSHMWDGSAETVPENMRIAEQLLERTAFNKQILEIEVGVVGGEEDGYAAEIDEKLYTTEEDAMAIVRALCTGENGRYITALVFGNVHGVYKPGSVQLRP